MPPVLEVRNLSTEFDIDEGIVHAVNDVSWNLDEGEVMFLVGESGCGKTVSVLSVMGLIPNPPGRVVSGEVLFGGKDLLKLSNPEMCKIRGKDIAMIFQDPMTSLNPVMRIGHQIEESLSLHLNLSRSEARKRAIQLLEMVAIPDAHDRASDFPHEFSGGMRQRVMIAMALACEPKVLIADEPTTSLDVTIQAQIMSLVKRLQSELGMAVIWITHDLGVVASLAERVAIMYAGRVVEQGKVDEIFGFPRHPYTLGLHISVPRLDEDVPETLKEIRGFPPDCINLSPGCDFEPRCNFSGENCLSIKPELSETDILDHYAACLKWEELADKGEATLGDYVHGKRKR